MLNCSRFERHHTRGFRGRGTRRVLPWLLGWETPVYAYPVAAVAAWLPDLDNPRSRLGNGLSPAKESSPERCDAPGELGAQGRLLYALPDRRAPHADSLFAGDTALRAPAPAARRFPIRDFFVALVAGYASHLAADALNTRGVPLFWPFGGVLSGSCRAEYAPAGWRNFWWLL